MSEAGKAETHEEPIVLTVTEEKVTNLSSFSGCEASVCRAALDAAEGNFEIASLRLYETLEQARRKRLAQERRDAESATRAELLLRRAPPMLRRQFSAALGKSLFWLTVSEGACMSDPTCVVQLCGQHPEPESPGDRVSG